MPASKLDVINDGLVRIGASPIASLAEQDAQGITAEAMFDTVTEDLMSQAPWSFALKEILLPELVLPAVDLRLQDWDHVYQLPDDRIRVLGLKCTSRYQLSGDQLYTDSNAPVLVYTYNASVTQWPAYFSNLAAIAFAAAVAIPVTDSGNRANIYTQQLERQRGRAMAADAQQVPAQVFNLMRIYARQSFNPLAGA